MPLLFLLPSPPKKSQHSERSDRRGFGEFFPRAPLGLSRSDWGSEVSAELLVALRYSDKIVCFQRGATDKTTIDVLLGEELLGV